MSEPILKADGFDNCVVGVVSGCGRQPVLAYDSSKIIAQLMKRDGMDREEAQEFFDFNIAGAYLGEGTPVFFGQIPTQGTWFPGPMDRGALLMSADQGASSMYASSSYASITTGPSSEVVVEKFIKFRGKGFIRATFDFSALEPEEHVHALNIILSSTITVVGPSYPEKTQAVEPLRKKTWGEKFWRSLGLVPGEKVTEVSHG